eukprot:241343-Ditylum_brightwellii.AAC.1
MPRTTLNGAIPMQHMGSTEKQVPALKLLQACHFLHLKHRGQKFIDLQNLMTSVKRTVMMKGTWTNDGWDEGTLMAM